MPPGCWGTPACWGQGLRDRGRRSRDAGHAHRAGDEPRRPSAALGSPRRPSGGPRRPSAALGGPRRPSASSPPRSSVARPARWSRSRVSSTRQPQACASRRRRSQKLPRSCTLTPAEALCGRFPTSGSGNFNSAWTNLKFVGALVFTKMLRCFCSKSRPWNLKYEHLKYENGCTCLLRREPSACIVRLHSFGTG